MKIVVECPICHNESVQQGKIPENGYYSASLLDNLVAEIDNNSLAYFTCSKGHKSVGFLSKDRFDVLLESGLLAYASGFHSEAVLSIAASLERLYELYIRTILHKHEISFEDVDVAWKGVNDQSERQLGAFCLLYLMETKKPFPIDQELSKFRNKVIHKGYIPTSQEVAEWADKVVQLMYSIIVNLKSNYSDSLTQIAFARGRHIKKALPKKSEAEELPFVSIHTPSIMGMDLPIDAFQRVTFLELVKHVESLRSKFGY